MRSIAGRVHYRDMSAGRKHKLRRWLGSMESEWKYATKGELVPLLRLVNKSTKGSKADMVKRLVKARAEFLNDSGVGYGYVDQW